MLDISSFLPMWRAALACIAVAALIALGAAIALLIWRPPRSVNEPVDISMQPTPRNRALLACMPSLSHYPCSWMLRGVHGSTLFGVLLQRAPAIAYTRHERIPLPDGGVIALDWHGGGSDRPVLLIIPGTRGHKDSVYVRSAASAAARLGFTVAVAALRGCGVPNLATPRCFDGAKHSDVHAVVTHVRACTQPSQRLYALGFSMGGGMLAHHLSVAGDAARIDAAVVISATTDYVAAVKHMSRTYSRLITLSVKSALCTHWRALRAVRGVSFLRGLLATSIAEWHDAVTCPLQGQADSNAFCRSVSFPDALQHVRAPLLCLHARNDPVCPHWTMPESACDVNPCVIMAKTNVGGHTGFPQGDAPWSSLTWDVQVAMEFFAAVDDTLVVCDRDKQAEGVDGAAAARDASATAFARFPTRKPRRLPRRSSVMADVTVR